MSPCLGRKRRVGQVRLFLKRTQLIQNLRTKGSRPILQKRLQAINSPPLCSFNWLVWMRVSSPPSCYVSPLTCLAYMKVCGAENGSNPTSSIFLGWGLSLITIPAFVYVMKHSKCVSTYTFPWFVILCLSAWNALKVLPEMCIVSCWSHLLKKCKSVLM